MKKEYLVKEDGVRLDKYISQIDNEISRMMIQKLIENNKVYVNNKIEKAKEELLAKYKSAFLLETRTLITNDYTKAKQNIEKIKNYFQSGGN